MGSASPIKRLIANKRVKQTGVLYISLVASLVLGVLVSVINTRLLGVQPFGDFKFLQTVWAVGVTFVTFGLFSTGGTLLARCDDKKQERCLNGGLLLISSAVGCLFVALSFVSAQPIGHFYGVALAEKLEKFAILAIVFPFQLYLQEALRGTNSIFLLSLLNALPQAIYIPAALLINHKFGFNVDLAILLYLSSIGVTVILVTILAHPSFSGAFSQIDALFKENKKLGMNIYFAVLMTTISSQISQFSLAYFFDTGMVGIFSLAITITMPLTLIPNAIATSFFKQFSKLDEIPSKVIMITWIVSFVTLAGFLFLIKDLILLLYSKDFIDVVPLAYACATGSLIHGVGDVYNRFLLAQGWTKDLRNNALLLGAISVVGYTSLVYQYGAAGAAATKILVDVFYLASMYEYYLRNKKTSAAGVMIEKSA